MLKPCSIKNMPLEHILLNPSIHAVFQCSINLFHEKIVGTFVGTFAIKINIKLLSKPSNTNGLRDFHKKIKVFQ